MTEPLRVLIVHDSAAEARVLADELERLDRPITTERVEDPLGLRVLLDHGRFDVAVSAWTIPGFGAAAALAILNERGLDVPLIVVGKSAEPGAVVEAMRAGARDYVLAHDLGRLAPAVDHELRASAARREQRRAQPALAALAVSTTRLRRAFEASVVGMAVCRADGTFVHANDAFLALIGYDRAELDAGRLAEDRITPREWREAAADAERALRTAGSFAPHEREYLRKDGTRVAVLIGGALIGPDESVTYAVDITERKQAEAALRGSEDQRRQAETMEAVGRLAGGIAHDFNNLMSVVLTYTALVADELPEADPKRADLAEVKAAAQEAAGLTQQLLAFSRHQVMRPVVSDLNELTQGMARLLQALLGNEVKLTLRCASGIGKVLIDPKQLGQVFMNLAMNAREAMPAGGRLLIETADAVLDAEQAAAHVGLVPGRHVLLSISDSGPGMEPALRTRVFEPFFTSKDRGKASGLGLSTAMGIVRQSGGDLWAESEPGRGTTFKIYLPVASTSSLRPRARRSEMPPPAAGAAPRSEPPGRETILLVEGDAKVRASTATVLRRLGYAALEAESCDAALALGARHGGPIHLLLTDVVTTSMTGSELAQRLMYQRPSLKVLYLGGYPADAPAHQPSLELDPDVALLPKPITPETLGATIRRVLDGD